MSIFTKSELVIQTSLQFGTTFYAFLTYLECLNKTQPKGLSLDLGTINKSGVMEWFNTDSPAKLSEALGDLNVAEIGSDLVMFSLNPDADSAVRLGFNLITNELVSFSYSCPPALAEKEVYRIDGLSIFKVMNSFVFVRGESKEYCFIVTLNNHLTPFIERVKGKELIKPIIKRTTGFKKLACNEFLEGVLGEPEPVVEPSVFNPQPDENAANLQFLKQTIPNIKTTIPVETIMEHADQYGVFVLEFICEVKQKMELDNEQQPPTV